MGKKKIVKTKQELEWSIVEFCMDELSGLSSVMQDEEFRKRYDALVEYIDKKLQLRTTGDITDRYVVVEQYED